MLTTGLEASGLDGEEHTTGGTHLSFSPGASKSKWVKIYQDMKIYKHSYGCGVVGLEDGNASKAFK